MRLDLNTNELYALTSALDNYLNGIGMDDNDEDESVLDAIVVRLGGLWWTL